MGKSPRMIAEVIAYDTEHKLIKMRLWIPENDAASDYFVTFIKHCTLTRRNALCFFKKKYGGFIARGTNKRQASPVFITDLSDGFHFLNRVFIFDPVDFAHFHVFFFKIGFITQHNGICLRIDSRHKSRFAQCNVKAFPLTDGIEWISFMGAKYLTIAVNKITAINP